MRGASGRRESRLYQAAVYAVLVLGGLPVVLPLYWLVLASLKSLDCTYIHPPEWLPLHVRHTVVIEGQPIPVTIFDDASQSRTGVFRVKMKRDAPDVAAGPPPAGHPAALRLPRGRIETEVTEELLAVVDGLERRVAPLMPPEAWAAADDVPVSLPGTRESALLAPNQLVTVEETSTYWSVLGVEIPVEVIGASPSDAAPREIVLKGPPPPVKIAPELYRPGEPGTASWCERRIPARLLAPASAAGYAVIQLVCPADGLPVPAAELRRETRVRHYALIDGVRQEVKRLRDQPDGLSQVEILHQPQRRSIPKPQLRSSRRTDCYATILGERRRIEPAPATLPDDPNQLISVHLPGVIAVAAERVHTERAVRPEWGNYQAAWREQSFALYVVNTLFIAALVVLGTVLSCGLVGYAFARLEFRGRDGLFLVLLATMMIPGQVTSIPTFVLFVKLGWIDTYRPLIVPSFLAGSAFFIFLFRQFLLTIPTDLEDAARIDGCGPLATWWLIMMPLSKPIIVTVAVFSFTGVWNDFLAPLLYINSDEKQTVALGLQSFKSAYQYFEPQLIMAASVMMILPTVLLFFLAQKAFIRGVVVTGVKG